MLSLNTPGLKQFYRARKIAEFAKLYSELSEGKKRIGKFPFTSYSWLRILSVPIYEHLIPKQLQRFPLSERKSYHAVYSKNEHHGIAV